MAVCWKDCLKMATNKIRYTLSGDPVLEQRIDETLTQIAQEIETIPEADLIAGIFLGGGYGRGEGGTGKNPDGTVKIYNDLDFFVFRKPSSAKQAHALDRALAGIGEKWSGILNADVDFAPSRTVASLKPVSDTLMFQELRAGNVPVFGDRNLLNALPAPDFRKIPASEGARLLLNRGAGLLLSSEKLGRDFSREADDFILRNICKAFLGCGDALLILEKRYTAGLWNRLNLLQGPLGSAYSEAAEFKRMPYTRSREELKKKFGDATDLWLKTVRSFFHLPEEADPDEVFRTILRSREIAEGSAIRNFLIHLYLSLMKRIYLPGWFSHPRRILLAQLYWKLFAKNQSSSYIKDQMNTKISRKWLSLWQRFN